MFDALGFGVFLIYFYLILFNINSLHGRFQTHEKSP